MNNIPEIIKKVKSGVVQIIFYRNGEKINSGSGFLCCNRLISNNHVFYPDGIPLNDTTVGIRFGDMLISNDDLIKISYDDFIKKMETSSPQEFNDYAIFKLDEGEYNGRYQFELIDHPSVKEGEKILIMGFPFGSRNLTSHIGYISSIYNNGVVDIIQLDASTNNGNSGGPVIDLKTCKVVGYVTRKQTGLAEQFDELVKSFDANIEVLTRLKGTLSWGKLDIMDIFSASQRQMKSIAWNLKRASNTGIGFAFSCNKLISEPFYDKKS